MTDADPTLPPRLSTATFDRLNGLVTRAEDRSDDRAVTETFTGTEVSRVPECAPADVTLAVERARDAQDRWAERSVDERERVVRRFHDVVLDRQDELLDLAQLESGKSRAHAFDEVMDVTLTSRYYGYRAADVLSTERRRPAVPLLSSPAEVVRHPVGVVGIISPWNYPITLAVSDAVPALLAGNAVVLKPAETTPYTALLLVELLREAGVPRDLVQVVTGDGATLGPPLVDDVDYVSFTGSTETGREVAAAAGRNLVDCSMELGGKNPLLVLDDADLDAAVEGAVGACFTNAGQLCIGTERVYVDESLYDEFRDRFVEAVSDLTLGTDYDYGVDVGSLASADQLETVREHVADARDRGATVHCGGEPRPDVGPYFYDPTVLTDLPVDAEAACEETFGPVVSLRPVSGEREAVDRANDTRYGLNASVWTENRERGRAVAREVEAGTVTINGGYVETWAAIDAPMGGMKESGIGRRHGPEGLLRYTESQTVAARRRAITHPVGVQDGLEARALTVALRLWRRLPFLR
ncbi:succinic semialdehyde dehydrogenase [Haloarchaeobius sp. HRN-SO-5]|uniref:succinic semialdehyde dehydrogenase n=1 Tax=Haloarchaeobius sp. HRN-SO-5 TaxID=3446118 RepID=UPI003EB77647